MADAPTTPPFSRRALLAGLTVLPIATTPAAAAQPSPHPDAVLLALGEALTASWDAETAAYACASGWSDEATQAYVQPFHDAWSAIVDAIIAHRATTLEGLGVKLVAYFSCQGAPSDAASPFGPDYDPCTDEVVLQSAGRDALAMWEARQ